ncbi:hypothetical protein [Massilia glaciei]|uniref:Uncharacterized protein n=1 Tax=Massilia glaciei TaxID=1524097 RepID=A0A2U2HPD4_9BURK|nr:hypothetical protein [Massilia glaciei]PWF49353.1 hypothetical protein C7C56_006925 [Massilia glaciei]
MQTAREEYRGYTIVVQPLKDCNDMWDFEYELTRLDDKAATPIKRAQTAGGHADEGVATLAGFKVAKIEVDNLLALEAAPGA